MKITMPFSLRLACVLIILIAIGFLGIIGKTLFAPLLFALLFALLLLPLSNFLENKLRFPRVLGVGVSVLLFLIAVSVIIYVLSAQIANLSQEWPLLKQQVGSSFQSFQNWLQFKFHLNISKQTEYINNTASKVLNSSGTIIEQTVLSISSLLLWSIFTLIYTFFILLYRRHLMRFLVAVFAKENATLIFEISEEIKTIVRKYISGLFFQMAILVGLSGLIFWLIGIKYIFLLALLIAVLNLIPYIGIYTALIIGACLTFATSDAHHVFYLFFAVVGIHLIDSNFLMPKIVGSQIRINPFIIILGVVAGELMWGIPGMFLSVSYLAMAKIIFDRVEGMKPWGMLLSDDAPVKKVKIKLKTSEEKEIIKAEELS